MDKTAKKTAKKTSPKVNVPNPIRNDSAPAPAVNPLAALKDRLASKAKDTQPKKAQRPTMELTPEIEDIFKAWVPSKVISDYFESHTQNYRNELVGMCFDLWTKKFWESQVQPANPKLETKNKGKSDMSCLFVVTNKFSVEVPDPQAPAASVKNLLKQLGVNDGDELVDSELSFEPITIVDLSRLANGYKGENGWIDPTAESLSAYEKIVKALLDNQAPDLTPEEQDLALIFKANTTVKDGFFQRVCNYCGNLDQLRSVLTVIKPQCQLRSPKFAESDSMEERNARLCQEAANILGASLESDEEDDDE